jgi:broad specificity phosphatase PhoE
MQTQTKTEQAEAIWVARHAERIDFADRTWPKTAPRPFDPHLSEKGMLQAQKLAQRLEGEGISHIFSSPYLRTLQTAWPIAEALDLPIKIEAGLGEWLNPQWFSTAPTYLASTEQPDLFARVDAAYASSIQPTYPETWAEFEARTVETTNLLIASHPGNILLIGHGATMQCVAQGLVTGKPPIKTPLCGLTLVSRAEDAWSLAINGDIAHLNDTQNLNQGVWM